MVLIILLLLYEERCLLKKQIQLPGLSVACKIADVVAAV